MTLFKIKQTYYQIIIGHLIVYLFLGCQTDIKKTDNNSFSEQKTKNAEKIVVVPDTIIELKNKEKIKENIINRINKASTEGKIFDTIYLNSFDEYLLLIPEITLPFTFGIDTLPSMSSAIAWFVNKTNYSLIYGNPICKFTTKYYVAIVIGMAVQGTLYHVYTFDSKGNRIDVETIYRDDGHVCLDCEYNKIENCFGTINKDYSIHYRHDTSLFVLIDKTRKDIEDSLLENDFEEKFYRITEFGIVENIK